jgi:hypothetical protein
MKLSKAQIYTNTHAIPSLRFEDQKLTSFAGVVILQKLFAELGLKERLRRCVAHLRSKRSYGAVTALQVLIVHMLLGYRRLRDVEFYQHDPMVKRLLGLRNIPGQSTLSRWLGDFTAGCVERLRALLREMVIERVAASGMGRLTMDFDGSVQSTKRHAEGTAVGFNKKKKGARSYYNLFCTIAQTGQIFDVLFRPGNVHDSNGALGFILECISEIQRHLPWVKVEVRVDGAFFDEFIVEALQEMGVEFTLSVPFHRLLELKAMVESRRFWWGLNGTLGYFERQWKPKSWARRYRFVFVRKRAAVQRKGPIQLDMFEPQDFVWEYKVIVTNKSVGARRVVRFHEGRGQQENVFAELKSDAQMDYVPVNSWVGNQIYLLCTLLAHNLGRELQMRVEQPAPRVSETRAPLWAFQKLDTLRKKLIQRAGRLTRPRGELTLTLGDEPAVRDGLLQYLAA